MHGFPEDDEMDPKEELSQVNRAIDDMSMRRDYLRREVSKRKMDPKDEKLVEVAWIAGEGKANERHLYKRITLLERRIAVRDEKLEELEDYDNWKNRALAAEATIARNKARRRK